jgi:L-lactate dehydrogenase complex protein LldE
MVTTLRRLGVDVGFNEAQTCCGQVAFNTGYRPEARSMAEHYIEVFENERSDFIVAPSGSCTAMVRNFYHELFPGEEDAAWRERFNRVQPRLREFSSSSAKNWALRTWERASPPELLTTMPVTCCASWVSPKGRDG